MLNYMFTGEKDSSSNESLNLSITSETDSSVTTVVERELTIADLPESEQIHFEPGELTDDSKDPTYIDMSRSSISTEDQADYVTMSNNNRGGHYGDNVANDNNKLSNDDLNDNYINGNVNAVFDAAASTTGDGTILPVPASFEDSSPDTSVTEAPREFQDGGETIYSTIERGVTLPRQISSGSRYLIILQWLPQHQDVCCNLIVWI